MLVVTIMMVVVMSVVVFDDGYDHWCDAKDDVDGCDGVMLKICNDEDNDDDDNGFNRVVRI